MWDKQHENLRGQVNIVRHEANTNKHKKTKASFMVVNDVTVLYDCK